MNATLFEVLSVLAGAPGDAAGIMERLRRIGGEDAVPSVPALYRHLRRATRSGWIEAEAPEPSEEGPGRPPNLYRLTRAGEEEVRREARRLERFTRLVGGGDAPGGEA